jgi:alginate O-acetyltransferase complex protein AlgI
VSAAFVLIATFSGQSKQSHAQVAVLCLPSLVATVVQSGLRTPELRPGNEPFDWEHSCSMSFAAPIFLWYFMPATLLLYWVLPGRWRNGLVAIASLAFYCYGAGPFVFLLMGCMVVNYAAGIAVDLDRFASRHSVRRAILISAVLIDLTILAVWKYGGFATNQIHALSSVLGVGSTPVVSLALPIGISFFTFHHLSYVVDVYRHSRKAQRSPVQFVTYIAMFPQLIAGPIVRYHEIAEQLADTNRPRLADFAEGFPRFAWGLTKKVVIADSVSPIADAVFGSSASELSTQAVWVGALAYAVQIYFDFSGYSDMAIGLARMFGFRLPENFNRPYSATSITDFWRRWHMSLSRWFRDYVYIPLGGNRNGAFQTYRNLLIVFVLTGFWHGANWTFLVWGMYHGSWLIIERLTGWEKRATSPVAVVFKRGFTFLLVVVGWVIFRSPNLPYALQYLERMFVPHGGQLPETVFAALTHYRLFLLSLGLLVVLVPGSWVFGKILARRDVRWTAPARWLVSGVCAPYAAIVVAAGTFSPFLYFQF